MFTGPELRSRERGLTLLEIVVGLGILSLMAGAIYGIVSGAVESTAALALIQSEDRRVETFLDRTRLAFAHLPATATLELKVLEADPLRQELIIRGVDHAFVWGNNGWWETPTVTIAPLRWPDERVAVPARADLRGKAERAAQRFSLAMTVPDFYRADSDGEPLPDSPLRSRLGHQLLQPDQQGRFWIDLLPEVDRVEWRFYDVAKKTWVELQQPGRPPLIELRLSVPGRKSPLRAVFETI
ncbi:MAG TPA: prepilin-type N-terminal cleavage/methylation domain-containing protein [Chthoniobacteraceae bacterium]|jgi:prepilin-type N-terminal cleavage/methylation domain-containing protein|nr:prepilin-type N-terminal cleavage/methylation domain-containing protein [Chthoniobacteraceae bacterium]